MPTSQIAKGGFTIEQLNIVGKRSGKGFIAHRAMLVNALTRALSDRVMLMDFTIGRRGFVAYLKALGGSNIVKVVPSANGHKSLKVICGANTGNLADSQWIGDNTPMTICEVRVSPNNSVIPNVGTGELADAIARVLPFTSKEDARPVLQCVYFAAKGGKLTLVSADGFRLAIISLDYDGEGQALIDRAELRGIANALNRAKRARVSFEVGDVKNLPSLVIDTELIRYKWVSNGGQYPDYEKLIPTTFNTYASFDTIEAIRAISSLKALTMAKDYPIDLTIGGGKIVMADPDNVGQAELSASTEGEGNIRMQGQYLADVLKACGGMVDFSLTDAKSPVLFSQNGYQVVVMPMLKAEAKAKAEPEADAVAEPELVKPKQRKAKQPVAAK